MEHKKITKKQLEKQLNNAVMFIERGSDYKGIVFSDRGLSIQIAKDFVVVSTNFHHNVWNKVTGIGYNIPCLYFETLVDIANEHKEDIKFKNDKGEVCYSLERLMNLDSLDKEEKTLVILIDRFVTILSDTSYAIGNKPQDVTNLMCQFISFLAKANIILDGKEEDVLQNEFFNEYIKAIRLMSLNVDSENDLVLEIKDDIYKIEEEAFDKIKSVVESKGGKMGNIIALPKKSDDEVQALNDLQN